MPFKLPSVHLVDATPGEEQAVPLKLLHFFSNADRPILQGTRMIGPGQVSLPYLKRLMKVRTRATRAHLRSDNLPTGRRRLRFAACLRPQ